MICFQNKSGSNKFSRVSKNLSFLVTYSTNACKFHLENIWGITKFSYRMYKMLNIIVKFLISLYFYRNVKMASPLHSPWWQYLKVHFSSELLLTAFHKTDAAADWASENSCQAVTAVAGKTGKKSCRKKNMIFVVVSFTYNILLYTWIVGCKKKSFRKHVCYVPDVEFWLNL